MWRTSHREALSFGTLRATKGVTRSPRPGGSGRLTSCALVPVAPAAAGVARPARRHEHALPQLGVGHGRQRRHVVSRRGEPAAPVGAHRPVAQQLSALAAIPRPVAGARHPASFVEIPCDANRSPSIEPDSLRSTTIELAALADRTIVRRERRASAAALAAGQLESPTSGVYVLARAPQRSGCSLCALGTGAMRYGACSV